MIIVCVILMQDVHRNMTTESSDGSEFYLVEVIAFVLKYLKCRLEDHLSITQNPIKSADFDWVITVPAIWKARGKRMMREAAYMVRKFNRIKVVGALSPTHCEYHYYNRGAHYHL